MAAVVPKNNVKKTKKPSIKKEKHNVKKEKTIGLKTADLYPFSLDEVIALGGEKVTWLCLEARMCVASS